MGRRQRIVCSCGGELTRPLPAKCPHCGAVLTGLQRRLAPALSAVCWVAGMFALLVAFLCWLLSR